MKEMEQRFGSVRNQEDCGKEGGFHFPMFIIPLTIGLMFLARRKRQHMRMMNRENWKNGVPPLFNEWHRRAHEAETQSQAPAAQES